MARFKWPIVHEWDYGGFPFTVSISRTGIITVVWRKGMPSDIPPHVWRAVADRARDDYNFRSRLLM